MKILLALAFLQLLPAPALFQRAGDYDDWEPWSQCSRSCGTGVSMRIHRCVRISGGNNCVGPTEAYRTCNTQECPMGSKDFREEQCSRFDGVEIRGRHHIWVPYYGAANPCELNCSPRGETFFHRHRLSVVDGTPCYPGRNDICVQGVCKRLGCDNMLESSLQEDPCLQCGGNGQSCFLVRQTFSTRDMPNGYHPLVTIPAGATTIRIREVAATRNYLAIKNSNGEYYLNGNRHMEFTRAIPVAGTVLYYERRAEGDPVPETILARGPTSEQLIVELMTRERNHGVVYEYYLPVDRPRERYSWSYDAWSHCSRECGPGYQTRRVYCSMNNEAYAEHLCADLPRPLSNRTCSMRECLQTYRFETGAWSACSVSCGDGFQTRGVQCVSRGGDGPQSVEDSYCAVQASRPLGRQACSMQPCPEYSISSFSTCSVTCGTGEQTREVFCVGPDGAHLPEHACNSLSRPHHTQTCQRPACPDDLTTDHRPDHMGLGRDPPCARSYYGCCPDGRTAAQGQYREGCPHEGCMRSRYGCCLDGVTAARGYNMAGCQDNSVYTPMFPSVARPHSEVCHTSTYGCCNDQVTVATGPGGEGCNDPPSDANGQDCSLPYTAGPCSTWTSRFYYDPATSSCVHFWYGGCQGNSNNFPSRAECLSRCRSVPGMSPAPGRVHQGSANGHTPGTNAATQAQRVRAAMYARRYGSRRSATAYRARG